MGITWDTHVDSNMRKYSLMVFETIIFIVLDLDSPKDRDMYPMRSKAWKQSNPWFPTICSFFKED